MSPCSGYSQQGFFVIYHKVATQVKSMEGMKIWFS